MEQLFRLAPLVRAELPRLAGGHHTDHPFPARKATREPPSALAQNRTEQNKINAPRIRAKLVQRLDPIHDEILELPLALAALAALVAVHDDDVLRARVALGRGAFLGYRRLLEDRLFEELAHVPKRDERGGRGGDDDNWDFAACGDRSPRLGMYT